MVKHQLNHMIFCDEKCSRLFPFHFMFDSELVITKVGKSLQKLISVDIGDDLLSHFKIIRPASLDLTFDGMKDFLNVLVIIEVQGKTNMVKMRGQFEYFEQSDSILFAGTPWFNDMNQLIEEGLGMKDFAPHDTHLDMLQALNSQESVTADMKILLDKLGTQKKEIEKRTEQLRINQSQLELLSIIAEQTVNGVIITDNLGKIEWVNESFTKITGYTLGECLNKTPGSLLQGPETNENTVSYMNDRIKKGLDFEAEIINYHKDGTPYWIKINARPIKNERGEVVKFFALEENITARMKTDQALREAIEKADATSQAKDIFLANMSHEMRTPLNAILGMGNQMKKTGLDKEQHFFLETMNAAAEHLLVVINDILDLSRIEAGKLQLENVDFDIFALITRCMQALSPKAEEKGIDFKMMIDDRISKILVGDPYRLNQILLNLLNNSIKFTEEGSVSIEVLMVKDTETSQQLRFMVDDTGIGMDNKFLDNIFKKFTQEDSSIARKYGGTGLGLNITKQLVELMGGSINVKSIKNIGSLFLIDLIFEKSNVDDIKIEKKIDISSTILTNVEVLLVEDNEMNRILAKTILKNFNAKTTEAENGLKGVELLKERSFDIVLMDIQMPIMGGFEATHYIRNELKMDIPIIALTANALKGEQEKCIAGGMDAYLSKPFKEEDLIRLMASLLNINDSSGIENIVDNKAKTKLEIPAEIHDEIPKAIIYDLEYLKEVFGDSPEIINSMLEAFLKEAELGIEQLTNYCTKTDADGLRSTAHRLKSNLAMLNAHELNQLAIEIEAQAKTGTITNDLIEKSNKFNDGLKMIIERIKSDFEIAV